MSVLSVDLGGTHLRAALVSKNGNITHPQRFVVGLKRSKRHILHLLLQCVDHYQSINKLKAISLGVPGIVSNGIIFASPHYPQWKNFNLKEELQKKVKLQVFVDNDVNMIARGELWKGKGRGLKNFILMALGTGVGGALVMNQQVWLGDDGFAGEFGHMVMNPMGRPCGCSSRGCFETYVSASGIVKRLSEMQNDGTWPGAKELLSLPEHLVVKGLAEKARQKDTQALQLFKDVGEVLGHGMASLVHITGIYHIILAGGVAQSSSFFLPQARQSLKAHLYKQTASKVKIIQSPLMDKSGLLGAAKLAYAS